MPFAICHMPVKLIDGKALAEKIKLDLKKKIEKMETKTGLATILVGTNPASQLYIKLKAKACTEVGIEFSSYFLDGSCTEEKILEVIDFLNKDQQITGILLQLPLPKKFDTDKIISKISAAKDVDGFHPDTKVISPNVLGIIELIKSTGENLKNKKVVVLSNSEKFAEPFKKLLKSSKVEYSNPQSPVSNLQSQIKSADVLIVAVGKPKFIKPNMVKKDSIIIDVGINKVDGKTIGDVDPSVDKIVAYRSPVPGGVGPMTIAMLLSNIYELTKK
ncbi:bifunctional 5,10-methylenetetrahydrofolate dehydrogenase/5,10-methenyltetrahydrofolate cyclohydrolase [Candidatus Falkowbacteria bacterium]|nr:bifunctional 5,10-methylenetetrahydrofolate dehydrogenase/5,10-methenyltetrahydrofolate cyclohydrolase [Candidatus Falkowbacteria bacterium]